MHLTAEDYLYKKYIFYFETNYNSINQKLKRKVKERIIILIKLKVFYIHISNKTATQYINIMRSSMHNIMSFNTFTSEHLHFEEK